MASWSAIARSIVVARLGDEVLLDHDPARVVERAQPRDHRLDARVALAEPAEDLSRVVGVQRGMRVAEPAQRLDARVLEVDVVDPGAPGGEPVRPGSTPPISR